MLTCYAYINFYLARASWTKQTNKKKKSFNIVSIKKKMYLIYFKIESMYIIYGNDEITHY